MTIDERNRFDNEGFFIAESFFSPNEVGPIPALIDEFAIEHETRLRSIGTEGISRPGEIAFTAHLSRKDPRIMAFCSHPNLVDLLTALIGPDVRLYWDQSVYKQPETPKEFPWHQDNGYTPVIPAQYYTCWLALTDATIDNGCIWV